MIRKPICSFLTFLVFFSLAIFGWAQNSGKTFEAYLRESAVPKKTLDVFVDPDQLSWAQFDAKMGYIVGRYMPRDGISRSFTISTSQQNGSRSSQIYSNRPCRINTYGNSFTQCHQVSDEETWQEYLAAHLGEPIRNFGVGGYGVYQSYRRMLKEEKTDHAAEHLIFYIWGDDHIRSLLRCRHALIYKVWDHAGGAMFHNNFWPYIDIDFKSGEFIEHDNLLSDVKSIYKMTDPQWMYENLKDDLALQMAAFSRGFIDEIDASKLNHLTGILQYNDFPEKSFSRRDVENLLNQYGFAATQHILDKVKRYAEKNQKKLMVVLFDPYRTMRELAEQKTRYDQTIVDYLRENHFNYFDMNVVHIRDFQDFNIPFQDYLKRYFIGHYNPRGNHFFAYSIKDSIVDWLEPKPLPYQETDQNLIHFQGYLPE